MRPLTSVAFSFLVSVALNAQTNVRIEAQRHEEDPNLTDIRLRFDSEANRRYLIEVSQDLSLWAPHYLAPFEPSVDGYWVSQLDSSNPANSREFYRVSRLPWSFQTLDDSGDWLGDLFLASNGSNAFLVYQNRYTNTLFYSASDQDGRFGPASVIETTGAVDEPGFWDNSGYGEITLLHYGTALYLVCTDDIQKKVVMLIKHDGSTAWVRHEISGVIDTHYWAFPKFTVSLTGILGVAYRGDGGTYFSYANHTSPENWHTVLLTTGTPSGSGDLKARFSTGDHAHVLIRYHGGFLVSSSDGSVVREDYPEDVPSDLSPEELKRVDSVSRNETLSNHVRLPDGRMVVGLTNGWRVVVAVAD